MLARTREIAVRKKLKLNREMIRRLMVAAAISAVGCTGGFITNQLGRFPRAGESVDSGGVRFTVERVEGKRIRRVRITRLARDPEPA